MADFYLTKSDFLDYRLCPSYCWVKKNRPDLSRQLFTLAEQRRFYWGQQLDRLAQKLYPDATTIGAVKIDQALLDTQQALSDGTAQVIFQAAVLGPQGFFARADILIKETHGWHLIEVKSAHATSTQTTTQTPLSSAPPSRLPELP